MVFIDHAAGALLAMMSMVIDPRVPEDLLTEPAGKRKGIKILGFQIF